MKRKFKYTKYIIITSIVILVSLILLKVYRNFLISEKKLLLICLDAADWDLIDPLIKEGKLPNLKKLKSQGASGVMAVPETLISEVIWTTIATGRTPHEHGITDRLLFDFQRRSLLYPTSSSVRAETIWSVASSYGKKVGVLGYMLTYPPQEINGVIISDRIFGMRNISYNSVNRSFPVFSKLCSAEEFDNFKILDTKILDINPVDFPDFWRPIESVDNFYFKFAKFLLNKEKFDFFCLYIRGIDVVGHQFWDCQFPELVNGKITSSKYKDIIRNYYIWCDKMIGELVDVAGRGTAIGVISDHGMQKRKNNRDYLFSNVDHLLKVAGISAFFYEGKEYILKNVTHDNYSQLKQLRIFSDASRDEIDRAKNICKNALKEIMVKETGKPAFNIVRETDDSIIIDSHMLGQTGQAAVIINHKEYPIGSFHIKNFPGDHKPGAVILFSGEGILAGQRIINSTIYDIYPTISHYLGLPVNKNMKGRVLLDIFEKKMRKVRYSDNKSRSKKIGANFKPSVPEYNPEQEEEIKDKMRSLGYLN